MNIHFVTILTVDTEGRPNRITTLGQVPEDRLAVISEKITALLSVETEDAVLPNARRIWVFDVDQSEYQKYIDIPGRCGRRAKHIDTNNSDECMFPSARAFAFHLGLGSHASIVTILEKEAALGYNTAKLRGVTFGYADSQGGRE